MQQRIGLITEGLVSHRTKVEVKAVHQKVNFDPGSPGLRTHGWGGTGDEGGAVDRAESLKLQRSEKSYRNIFHVISKDKMEQYQQMKALVCENMNVRA